MFDMAKRSALRKIADLHHETEDKAQLDPLARMASIDRVMEVARPFLHQATDVMDVGCGFGYGVLYFAERNIRVFGVEKVALKAAQARQLLDRVGVPHTTPSTISITGTPGVMTADFFTLEDSAVADLLTLFYVSGEMVQQAGFLTQCRRLLRPGGQVLISTEVEPIDVNSMLEAMNLRCNVNLIGIPNNFERTALVLS